MKYLVTASEMKQYDANTIEKIGIPGMVLMERAALAAFSVIEERFGQGSQGAEKRKDSENKVLILTGTGNNGGDGLALARLLCEAGWSVDVWCVGNPDQASGQWKQQEHILNNYPVRVGSKPQREEYNIIVDALFGVGLSREITGEYARAIETCNDMNGIKLAVDVPSGIHSDTGAVLGCAFRADMTVTFGFAKRGLVLYPGAVYAGEVICAPIGITERSFYGRMPEMFYYDEPVEKLLPARDPAGNKGTFGKVLLIAGSPYMAGAAVLCAKAAYRAGAGMVKVLTPDENRIILQETVPEALLGTYENLEESLAWADVIGIGPGMGTNEKSRKVLCRVIGESSLPLVVDADGLNLLSGDGTLTEMLAQQGKKGRIIVLTPHVGELSRLTNQPISVLKKDLPGWGKELSEKLHAVAAVKDARTFVCREGKPVCANIRGNSGMATAGSGDVLAGIITALLAQGMTDFDSACVGVYLHGAAGERASADKGEYGCMAGDIAEGIGRMKGSR